MSPTLKTSAEKIKTLQSIALYQEHSTLEFDLHYILMPLLSCLFRLSESLVGKTHFLCMHQSLQGKAAQRFRKSWPVVISTPL